MKQWTKLLLGLFLALFITNCSQKEDFLPAAESADAELTLRAGPNSPSPAVPNQYIVVLKDGADSPRAAAAELAKGFGLSVGQVYEHALRGFSARIPESALNGLRRSPRVAYIEPDLIMSTTAQTVPTGIRRIEADLNATANIDGIDDAIDVDVAIIDTGIDIDHPDLRVHDGRRFWTTGFGPIIIDSGEDDNYDDDHGHGSHVGGTVGAIDNGSGVVGVAPGVRLWAVKVLDSGGSGYLSDIIKGIDWVTARAGQIEVANMSLGGQGASSAYRTAIQNSVNAGIVYTVAAGNSGANVYGDGTFGNSDDYIPAAYPEVATISALADTDGQPGGLGSSTSYGNDDSFASFSNYSHQVVGSNPVSSPGLAIDLILPGVSIYSTYQNGQYATASGTSMAAPHAAGLAALYIAQNGRANDAAGVYAIRQALIDAGMAQNGPNGLSTLDDPDGNEEPLGWAGPSGPQAPVANAGGDQTIEDSNGDGSEMVTLDGSGSFDPDGTIVLYEWDVDGDGTTDHTGVSVDVTFTVGTHNVTLKVTDDSGAGDSDGAVITITAPQPNQPPIADAGGDQTVTDNDDNGSEDVTLDGSNSSDPDGTITSYEWDIDNDGTTDLTGAVVTPSFSVGAHTVTLTVTDNESAQSSDVITVTVEPAPAGISVAGISPDQTGAGSSVSVTISGTGFAAGATVVLENGKGPTPSVSNIVVVSSTQINATITAGNGGPKGDRVWDVRVTNPDGGTAVLANGFTITK